MSAFAYGTTYFSAVLFIGYAGRLGWGFGIQTLWIVLGNTLVGTLLAWLILAGRTHDMTVRLNALTMPEFLQARYEVFFLTILLTEQLLRADEYVEKEQWVEEWFHAD